MIDEKECAKCGETKKFSEFHKAKLGKYGLTTVCKVCKSEYNKKYVKNNSDKEKERKKKYQKNNPEKMREYSKKYQKNNPEKVRISRKKYYQKNREAYIEYSKKWQKNNPEKAFENDVIKRLKHTTILTTADIRQYPELIETVKTNRLIKRLIRDARK
jgi:transketolase